MTRKALRECSNRFPARVTGEDGTPSKRRTFLCRERTDGGFMLKHWKCLRCKLERTECES